MQRSVVLLVAVAAVTAGCLGNFGSSSATKETTGDVGPGIPVLPRPHAQPLADGPFSFRVKEYDEGTLKVGGRTHEHKNYTYDAKLRGVLFVPQGTGPFPVLVFLHGQHATCGLAGREQFVSPPMGNCESAGDPWHVYPNHRGYDYLGRHLASHGFVVASINGKEVNDRNGAGDVGMWARGELIVGTLDLLAAAHRGEKDLDLAGKLDLARIGLMGHSRGGEGVVTATHVNALRAEPHRILAVIPLAPTDFNYRGVRDAALLSILPYCDGDVFSLHGLRTFDHSRFLDQDAKVQLVVFGANHNNYNTQWGRMVAGVVPDGDDSVMFSRHNQPDCDVPRSLGGGKLALDDVYREAILHIGGFFRWVVGNDTSLAPYFHGGEPIPPAACPGRVASCPDAVRLSALLPGRTWILNVTSEGLNPMLGAASVTGFSAANPCAFSRCAANVYSYAWAMDLSWQQRASVAVAVPAGALEGADVIAFRAGVPSWGDQNDPRSAVDLNVVLVDASGARHAQTVSSHSRALLHPPGEVHETTAGPGARVGATKVSYNMVRIPLSAFPVDPANVTSVELVFDKTPSGRILLADMWAQPETGAALAG